MDLATRDVVELVHTAGWTFGTPPLAGICDGTDDEREEGKVDSFGVVIVGVTGVKGAAVVTVIVFVVVMAKEGECFCCGVGTEKSDVEVE